MKYAVILGDGMAGEPLPALGGMTTLEFAKTPAMNALAGMGEMGMVQTVPSSMKPGSDVANLAVLGYDPETNYSGRSPLEALSVGVEMESSDIVFRCNLVSLSEEEPYAEKTILDHSSGEISTSDADILMDAIRAAFNSPEFQFYTGTSYRHITIWKEGTLAELIPPHDHLGEKIGAYLPRESALRYMMEKSFSILNDHPLNQQRAAQGKRKANSLWFWGAGTKPALGSFAGKTGLQAAMISAVDLLKGIAVGSGMKVCQAPGATGSLDTNYEGKTQAALQALLEDGCDLAYIHVEAPDEMGHQGNMFHKIQSIQYLDCRVVSPLKKALDASGEDYKILILPDHPTPIRIRTHTAKPVPYIIYDSRIQRRTIANYCEREAAATGIFLSEGHKLMARFIKK